MKETFISSFELRGSRVSLVRAADNFYTVRVHQLGQAERLACRDTSHEVVRARYDECVLALQLIRGGHAA